MKSFIVSRKGSTAISYLLSDVSLKPYTAHCYFYEKKENS
jgi:hypothetical protein